MIILRNLLFKPVLRIMDERRERVLKAKQKQDQLEKMTIEYETLCKQKNESLVKERKKLVKQKVEEIRQLSKESVEKAGAERIREVEAFRQKSHEDHERIIAVLSEHSEKIATVFADSLVKEQ